MWYESTGFQDSNVVWKALHPIVSKYYIIAFQAAVFKKKDKSCVTKARFLKIDDLFFDWSIITIHSELICYSIN